MVTPDTIAKHRKPITPSGPSPAREALRRRLPDFRAVGLFSAIISLLTLTGSFYMLQVYDRVLVSRSVETLLVVSAVALLAFALQGSLDSFRARILSRIGAQFDLDVSALAFRASTILPMRGATVSKAMEPLRDVDLVRAFLSGPGPTAIFDLPFMPIFVAACFLLHPWLGWLAVGGAVVIVFLTVLTDHKTKGPLRAANAKGAGRQIFAESTRRHCEAIDAMGMHRSLGDRWESHSSEFRDASLAASDTQSGLGSFAKIFRMVLQSGTLGLGAFLAVRQEISGGAMIAASIMIARALAPIETAIANWKGFVAARDAYSRLQDSLGIAIEPDRVSLAPPEARVAVETLTVTAPGKVEPILINVSFELRAGDGLGIIGPSGSGKSSLARALVGVWQPLKGGVRLDGAMIGHWDRDVIGRHIGYLPQDLGLPDATVAETISRFDPKRDAESIVRAAKAASAHDVILGLPEGYDTRVGEGAANLSGGQRQRLGLARALYGDPFLVVLDEPNSNLDSDGDAALTLAIAAVRARDGIVVVITHRPAGLAAVDKVAYVADKGVKLFGPKKEVLAALSVPADIIPVGRPTAANRNGSIGNG